MSNKQYDDLALIYIQTFATPGGLEVLNDLRHTFDNVWYPAKDNITLEMHSGARMVIEHIINKMKSVDKVKAAEVVFNSECLK